MNVLERRAGVFVGLSFLNVVISFLGFFNNVEKLKNQYPEIPPKELLDYAFDNNLIDMKWPYSEWGPEEWIVNFEYVFTINFIALIACIGSLLTRKKDIINLPE